jgi:hypothetical protein
MADKKGVFSQALSLVEMKRRHGLLSRLCTEIGARSVSAFHQSTASMSWNHGTGDSPSRVGFVSLFLPNF